MAAFVTAPLRSWCVALEFLLVGVVFCICWCTSSHAVEQLSCVLAALACPDATIGRPLHSPRPKPQKECPKTLKAHTLDTVSQAGERTTKESDIQFIISPSPKFSTARKVPVPGQGAGLGFVQTRRERR